MVSFASVVKERSNTNMHFCVVLNCSFHRQVLHSCFYYLFRLDNADEEFGPDPPMPETPKKGKKRKAGKEPIEKKEKKQKKEKKKKKGKVEEVLVNGNVQFHFCHIG